MLECYNYSNLQAIELQLVDPQTRTHTRTHIQTNTQIHTHIQTNTQIHKHTQTHIHTDTDTQIHTYTHTHIHIHIAIQHTHTQTPIYRHIETHTQKPTQTYTHTTHIHSPLKVRTQERLFLVSMSSSGIPHHSSSIHSENFGADRTVGLNVTIL